MCYEDTFYLLFPYDILSLRKLITWYKALIENSDESAEFKRYEANRKVFEMGTLYDSEH